MTRRDTAVRTVDLRGDDVRGTDVRGTDVLGSTAGPAAGAARAVAGVVDPAAALPPGGYSRVLHDVPAAVLLVDVRHGTVVQANPAGRELAPGLRLPALSATWGAAAGLVAPGGEPYPDGESPLDRAAGGDPVFGEPVAVPDGPGRRTMWVTGFPLPRDREDLALIVLFDVETSLPDARIRDRAVIAAGLSFTISDPRVPDNPLVFVNPAFERTTGYGSTRSSGATAASCRARTPTRRRCSRSATRSPAESTPS